MNEETLGRLFRIGTPVAVVVGILLVVVGNPALTTGGVLLLIFGILSLMPALRFTWWTES